MEGFTAVLLIALVTLRPSIVDTQDAARTLYGEGDFVVGGGHNSAFRIQHLDRNVRDIAGPVRDARSIGYESQLRRAVRRLNLNRPHNLAVLCSVGSESSSRIGHIP